MRMEGRGGVEVGPYLRPLTKQLLQATILQLLGVKRI